MARDGCSSSNDIDGGAGGGGNAGAGGLDTALGADGRCTSVIEQQSFHRVQQHGQRTIADPFLAFSLISVRNRPTCVEISTGQSTFQLSNTVTLASSMIYFVQIPGL